jgi:hypothetical protein
MKDVTYTQVLHTPTLNANLISISGFDRAGLTITFGSRQGVIQKVNGTVVLTAYLEKGMYIIDEVEGDERATGPIMLGSLSQPTFLKQWHRHLAHCSPLIIQEMANGNLVDGLMISEDSLRGKCKDCILG